MKIRMNYLKKYFGGGFFINNITKDTGHLTTRAVIEENTT